MSLTAELLRELLTTLKTDSSRRGNKRRAPRVGMRNPVQVASISDEFQEFQGWIRNISATGLGLLSPRWLAAGTRFIIPFERIDLSSMRVLYTTTHSKLVAPELYAVGGRMLRLVDEPDLLPQRVAS